MSRYLFFHLHCPADEVAVHKIHQPGMRNMSVSLIVEIIRVMGIPPRSIRLQYKITPGKFSATGIFISSSLLLYTIFSVTFPYMNFFFASSPTPLHFYDGLSLGYFVLTI